MKTENDFPEQNKSDPDTSEPQIEKTFWQKLQEMPYSNDKIGQAFSIRWSKPKSPAETDKEKKTDAENCDDATNHL